MNRYCHWLAAEPYDNMEEMDGPKWQEVLLADTEDLCYLSGIFVLANMSWSVLVMFSQQLWLVSTVLSLVTVIRDKELLVKPCR